MQLIIGFTYKTRERPMDLAHFLRPGKTDLRTNPVKQTAPQKKRAGLQSGRKQLLIKLHDVFETMRLAGYARTTIYTTFRSLNGFVTFVDSTGRPLALKDVESRFIEWSSALKEQVRLRKRQYNSIYALVRNVASILSPVLGMSTRRLTHRAGVRAPNRNKARLGRQSDKHKLGDVPGFIDDLTDIIECLDGEKFWAPLPIDVTLRSTSTSYQLWSHLKRPDLMPALNGTHKGRPSVVRRAILQREQRGHSKRIETRLPLFNARTQAEYLLFLANTSMNVAEAQSLEDADFVFRSFEDAYLVEERHKKRKGGPVEFYLNKPYKPRFEAYIAWRRNTAPASASKRLFALIPVYGPEDDSVSVARVKAILKAAQRPWFPPRALRRVKGNWIRRRSGSVDHASLALQHTPNEHVRSYTDPDYQVSRKEWAAFFETIDPSSTKVKTSPAQSHCEAPSHPQKVPFASDNTPDPDCGNPAGCWFCIHHAMVDSFDFAWSALSQRELERYKLAAHRALYENTDSPAQKLIKRIDDSMDAFRKRGEPNASWFKEAEDRMRQEHYHPRWDFAIQLISLR